MGKDQEKDLRAQTLAEKLLWVQASLKAPKGQYNAFGKYKYRNCEDIFEALKPLLHQSGLTLSVTDDLVMVGERYYIKATATVRDSEHALSSSAFAREEENKKGMDSSQLSGSTSSYSRKYALNGLFLIDDTKDSDATNQHGKGQQAPQNKPQEPNFIPPSAKQKEFYFSLLKGKYGSTGVIPADVLATARQLGKMAMAKEIDKMQKEIEGE